jgi:two-component system phosphate regulon sensor histidine kinase PhoR
LPLFARLRERSVDVAVPAREHSQLAAVRDAMRRAQDALAHGASSGANALLPRLLLWDPALVPCVLLWHPGPGAGDGRGAVIAATALADRMMRGLPDGDSPIPLLGESRVLPGADAGVPVIEGLWSVVPHDSAIDLPWTAQPAAALAAAIVLLLVLAGSGAFAFRALRQEALAVRARAEFLTVVTHELKTPLAAIRLLAEMMVEDRVPAGKTDEYYRLLAGEAARLSMLIENVLDLGRMERGERAYDLRACDLGEVAREAAVLFAPIAQRDGLQLRSDLGDGAVPGAADRGALLQALLNVLDNARKYASRGGTIELRTEREGGRLAITVRDFGPGVPAGEREAIFARFVRGDAHRHGSIPGVGLGLYLARAIARRHGGDLVCRAPADGGPGAEFAFALPLAAAPAQEVPA